jgi:hypothetical protein
LTNDAQLRNRKPGPSVLGIEHRPGLGNALWPGNFRVLGPGTSALELHQKNQGELQNQKPSAHGLLRRRTRRGSAVPISSEPAPSHRPWTFASGATPMRTKPIYYAANRKPDKIGTFYFAGNRNFLLCLDRKQRQEAEAEPAEGFCPTGKSLLRAGVNRTGALVS